MRLCPSQYIHPYHANKEGWKESGTGLCINSIISKYTKSCSVDESPISDFDINEITYLDYKVPSKSKLPEEDLLVLEQYLLTSTPHKILHIVNDDHIRPLLFNRHWEQLLQFLNNAEKRLCPSLEILNLDYHKLYTETFPEIKSTDWLQIDYHHVLSDSVAFHYPIYLSPEAGTKWVERYNQQPVQYDPEADRVKASRKFS